MHDGDVEPGTLRALLASDLEVVLAWRNHPAIRRHMYTRHEISASEHRAWFEKSAADPLRTLMIYERGGTPLGFMSFDRCAHAHDVLVWGFYASPDAPGGTGRGLGESALRHAFEVLSAHKLYGEVLASNERSAAFHRALGFSVEGTLRDQHRRGDERDSIICFGLLRNEWVSEPHRGKP